jgi:hypothetical protein
LNYKAILGPNTLFEAVVGRSSRNQKRKTLSGETGHLSFFYIDIGQMTIGRFAVMLGLRLDTQKIYNNVGDLPVNWGLEDFFSPRFSLAWDITGDGANVFKE